MSTWKEITDPENIELDGEDINILVSTDKDGNNYVYMKKDVFLRALLQQLIEDNDGN